MLKYTNKLTESERQLLFDALPLITLLIGGADGLLDEKEKEWSERVAKIRSYANPPELQDYYEKAGNTFRERLDYYIDEMPDDTKKRTEQISKELKKLTAILKKLREDQAVQLLVSWRSYAKHVANASGGFMTYLREGPKEANYTDLPMIDFQSSI